MAEKKESHQDPELTFSSLYTSKVLDSTIHQKDTAEACVSVNMSKGVWGEKVGQLEGIERGVSWIFSNSMSPSLLTRGVIKGVSQSGKLRCVVAQGRGKNVASWASPLSGRRASHIQDIPHRSWTKPRREIQCLFILVWLRWINLMSMPL